MNALDTDRIIDSTSPSTPRPSRRRGWLALGAAAVIGVAGITAGLALVDTDDNPGRPIVDAPVEDPPPAPRTASVAKPLTDTTPMELDRIGPIAVGMTLDEASAAHGQPVAIDPRTDLGRGCAHAVATGGPAGLRFMVVNGKIVRIEMGRGPVTTREGIGAGSPAQDVLAAYAGRVRIEGHPYAARTGGQYLIIEGAVAGSPMSLLFETDGSRVTMFRSGLTDAVMAPEGCA